MLYTALVISAILLLIVNLIAWRAKHPVAPILATAFPIGLASLGFCMIGLPPVLLQAALVSVVALIWGASRARPRRFLMFSCVATLVSYAIPGYFAFQKTRHLKEAFPYISMDDRLPPPKKERPRQTLPADTAYGLAEMETLMEDEALRSHRKSSLRQIHEETLRLFIDQPGFGATRMEGVSEAMLKPGPHDFRHRPGIRPRPEDSEDMLESGPSNSQSGTPSASPWLPEQLRKEPILGKRPDDLVSLHRKIILDFVNPESFGYIKDRQHVAGFWEHQVSQMPAPSRPWKIQMIDLIGLLLHDKPVVYVSERLPRMDELREAPIRNLDDFESAGLRALQSGEDLFVRERGEERRMLGAIRAVRQCLVCHDGERGDLLGAFSYRMTADEK